MTFRKEQGTLILLANLIVFHIVYYKPTSIGVVHCLINPFRLSLKYSKEALAQMNERENNGESVDGEQGDLIPYMISKTELSEEKVFNVIGEIFFVGVDTVSLIYKLF